MPATPASSPPAGTWTVLKLQKSGAPCLLFLYFPFCKFESNYGSSSEQSICTNFAESCLTAFYRELLSQPAHISCVCFGTPHPGVASLLSLVLGHFSAGKGHPWEQKLLLHQKGVRWAQLLITRLTQTRCECCGNSTTKASCQSHPFLLPAIQGSR